MAFEYIGTPLEQTEQRKKQGEQNFPFETPNQTLVKTGTESYPKFLDYRTNFIQYIGGVDYQLTDTGAKNGFYMDIVGCYNTTGRPFRMGICAPYFHTYYQINYHGCFGLRMPIVQTVNGHAYVTYHILLCVCAAGSGVDGAPVPTMSDSRVVGLGSGDNDYTNFGINSFELDSFTRSGLYPRPQYGYGGIIRESVIQGRLHSIEDAIASASDFGRVYAMNFMYSNEPSYLGYFLLISDNSGIYTYPHRMDSFSDDQYNSGGQSQDAVMATNLPIWDISTDSHVGDILAYLRSGVTYNTWDGYSRYEPDFDVSIEDTSTHWKVKVCGQPVDNVKIAWSTPDIEQLGKAAQREWRACVWVQGHFEDGLYVDLPTMELYGYLYDGAYPYQQCYLSWDDIWSHCFSAGIFSSKKAKIRIAFCVYAGDQTSAKGFVDVEYDSMATPNYGFIEATDNSTITVGRYSDPDEPIDPDDDYDPDGDGDFPDDDDIEPDGGISVNDGGFCRVYKFNSTELLNVARYFWNDGDDSFISKYVNAVNDPVECILSCGYMPCNASGEINTQVSIGNVAFTNCTGTLVTHSTLRTFIGYLNVPEIYHSFLDYQPYTNLTIFLPYIGFKTLPTNLFMGKRLGVYYAFDLITGACKALLTTRQNDSQGHGYDQYVMSFDGDCMIHIPMTASNNSDVFMQRLRSAVEAGTAIASASIGTVSNSRTIGSVATSETIKAPKGKGGRLSTQKATSYSRDTDLTTSRDTHNWGGVISQVVGSGLDIAMAKHSFDSNGGASSAVCSVEPNKVFIIIDSPIVQYPESYEHNCGKPCELTLKLGSISGYTECDPGIELRGLPCTEEEKAIILRELSSGVYL